MFLADFCKLINEMEGWRPGLPSWINNNPGNLDVVKDHHGRIVGPGAEVIGADARGRAVYAKVSDGWKALEGVVLEIVQEHPEVSLETFFAGERDDHGQLLPGGYPGYAPKGDARGPNNPDTYAQFMAKGLKIPAAAPLAPYFV